MNLCDDNRFKTIEAAKTALIKGTNIEDSPEEMKVLDSFLLRCWQMGWLDKYDQIKTIELISDTSGLITKRMAIVALNTEIMIKRLNGEEETLDEFDTEEIIRKLMPMQSYTSNALKALNNVNAIQFNALDSISRQVAINALETTKRIASNELHSGKVLRLFNDVLNSLIKIMSLLPPALEALKPVAIRVESKNTVDLPETEGSDPSQIIHDAIDNTAFAEEEYPGIKEQLHRSVEEWEKLQPVFTEIAEEYKKSCEISYINEPLAHALHEVWKKHDRRDTNRNE